MKIRPSTKVAAPLYPTLVAVLGAVLTGCDRQSVPGIEPMHVVGKELPEEVKREQPEPVKTVEQNTGEEGGCAPVSSGDE